MDSALARRSKELFGLALELEPHEREAFVNEQCKGDRALLAELKSLLAAHVQADRFLEPPDAGTPPGESESSAPDELLASEGYAIAGYRLLRVIGVGGMGVVYEAEQQSPHRRVAVKMLRPGLAPSSVSRRLRMEAEILARLKHPGIAQVYAAGVEAGPGASELPYFVMEYIAGATPITQFANDRKLSSRERLALFLKVCEAIHHGHQRGVIHRDLKPGNVLIDMSGNPKVIDFGVARMTDADVTIATLQTDVGQLVGTLRYMSPEQCEGDSAEVDIRCDVYALGVLLYELLTGQLPYDFTTSYPFEIPRVIREQEPRRPSAISRALRGDIETIVLKSLEKDPGRRYQSALDMAQDIWRFLNNEPIEAKRDRAAYVFKKALVRHRKAATAACLLAILVTSSAIGFGVLYGLAERQRQVAEERAAALHRKDYFNSIALAQNACESANAVEMIGLLDRCPADLRGWEWHFLRNLADESVMTIPAHDGAAIAAAFSPDDRMILSAGRDDKTLKLWDADKGTLLRTFTGHTTMIACAALSPDGTRVASGGFDADGKVRIWNTRTGSELLTLRGHVWTTADLVFAPDNTRIISGAAQHERLARDHLVKVWNAATGELLMQLFDGDADIRALAISPDGNVIASGGTDSFIRLWDAQTGRTLHDFAAHDKKVESLVFSRDGRHLYSGSWDKSVKVWDPETGELLMTFPTHDSEIFDLALSPDGEQLISATRGSIEIWDALSGKLLHRLLGHLGYVLSVGFSADGSHIVSASNDGTVKVWNPRQRDSAFTLGRHENIVDAVACSPDGRWIASGGRDNTIKVYDAEHHRQVAAFRVHDGPITALAFSSKGKWLISGSVDRTAKVCEVPSGVVYRTLQGDHGRILTVACSSDSRLIATGTLDGSIILWSFQTGAPIMSIAAGDDGVHSLAFSPDGGELVSGGWEHAVKRWNTTTGKLTGTLVGNDDGIEAVAYSPDGTRIASAGLDGTIQVWDAYTGEHLHTLRGHRHTVKDVVFSPDGQRIVSASWDTTMKVWDAATGQLALTLRGHDNSVLCVAFAPDGRHIISGSVDKTVKIWDAGSVE
ncbi:MAG: protein kinase [Phycisphaerales bacterium]|nr:MAG: protein kinase [Phycisphaerales bacterium]